MGAIQTSPGACGYDKHGDCVGQCPYTTELFPLIPSHNIFKNLAGDS